MLTRLIGICLALCCNAYTAAAPAETPANYDRRNWSPIDGAPANVWQIAQSSDGLLWFASPAGLYRYDGERFQRVDTVYGHALQSNNINGVFALRQGIGVFYQFGGLSIFTPAHSTFHDSKTGLPPGNLGAATQGPDGTLYAGTSAGLAILRNGKWQLQTDQGLPSERVTYIEFDQAGVLWVEQSDLLFARAAGSSRFHAVLKHAAQRTPDLIAGQIHAYLPDGKVVRLALGQPPVTILDQLVLTADTLFQGPQQSLWAWLSKRGGLVRLRPRPDGSYTIAASYDRQPVSQNTVMSVLRDREDNIWLGTQNGVERLRVQRVHSLTVPGRIFMPYIYPGLGQTILVSGQVAPTVQRLNNGTLGKAYDLPNVDAMWREHAASLWVSNRAGLYHLTPGKQQHYPLPVALKKWQSVQALTVSNTGEVLISIVGQGVHQLRQQQWQTVDTSAIGQDAIPIVMHASRSGPVWFGFSHNRIGQLDGATVRPLAIGSAHNIGNVLSMVEVDGRLLAGGENGLLWIDAQGSHLLRPQQMAAFRGLSGLVLDHQGNLWAHASDGIYQIRKTELDQFWRQPERRLAWQVLNLADGIKGNAAQINPLPSLNLSDDGKVLYATNAQVGWFDPASMPRNTRVPDVLLLGLRVAGIELTPQANTQLAAGTSAIEFRYAVTAMSAPEQVKIQYRLSGIDPDWQQARGERVARYTNLPPGKYRFQVIAANEDDLWNEQGALFDFEILPMYWQTGWFRLCIFLLLAAFALLLHRKRLALATTRATERMQARLEERERIARNLHDDLLQGVHALILRCSTILSRLPQGSQEERILDNVLEQAEQLVQQTRAQVMDLRGDADSRQLIAGMLQELELNEPAIAGRLQVRVSGALEQIPPVVTLELCRILKEAAVNAVRHAEASEIVLTLDVNNGLVTGAVSDNGRGMPAEVAQHGVAGHWGITGMRERLELLGGTLVIETGNTGTTVRLRLQLANPDR